MLAHFHLTQPNLLQVHFALSAFNKMQLNFNFSGMLVIDYGAVGVLFYCSEFQVECFIYLYLKSI